MKRCLMEELHCLDDDSNCLEPFRAAVVVWPLLVFAECEHVVVVGCGIDACVVVVDLADSVVDYRCCCHEHDDCCMANICKQETRC